MLNECWKSKDVFVDVSSAAELEVIFVKALKELLRIMLLIIPEWKERAFFDIHDAIPGEFEAISHDAHSFLENREATGFLIWTSWLGVYFLKDFKKDCQDRRLDSTNACRS